MADKKPSFTRKIVHAGGWQVARRAAKMLPFGGTIVVVGLVGHDIKKKGLLGGVVNSGLDAIPFVGLAKNAGRACYRRLHTGSKHGQRRKRKMK